MKKLNKLFLALAGISAVSAGLAVGTMAFKADSMSPAVADAPTQGQTIYLTPEAGWTGSDAVFGFYFFNSSTTSTAFSSVMTLVEGNSNYETIVPTGTWDRAIAIRLKKGSTEVNWANKWNQTSDITLGDFNGIQITSLNGDSCTYNTYTYQTSDRMVLWGTQFTSAFSGVCVADGGTDSTALETKWEAREAQYGNMGSEVKTAIHDAVASDTGNAYNKALALYDYIESKYNPTGAQTGSVTAVNFIGRTVTPLSGAAKVTSITNDASSTLVLGGIAAAAVLAAGGYFFVRKKRVD